MKTIIKLLCVTSILFLFSFGFTGCQKKPDRSRFQPIKNGKASISDYMEEEINKDYETIKKPETDEENAAAPSHLKSSDEIFKKMKDSKSKDIIEINEKVFITQINDIYYNFDDYKDKTIVVEGMYSVFESMLSDETSPVVYRNGPGCCNNDGWAGFLLKYDGKEPKENDWIRVMGTPSLETTEEGYTNLFLNVSDLEVLDERGAELVGQ